MFNGKKILAVVPARGGSKQIKLKNLIPFRGTPLVGLAGLTIQQAGFFDRAIVSTDHPKIAEVAKLHGLEAPFFRPKALSGDRIGDAEVLEHSLKEAEKIYHTIYDIIVMVQPTSPLRKPKHLHDAVELLIKSKGDAVWSVSPTDSKEHPYKQLTNENGKLVFFSPKGESVIARQQLHTVYHRNGAVYALTRSCLLEQKTIKGKKTIPLVIEEPMISIDTLFDLELAQWLDQKKIA